jgi:WD40 repeat protein
LVRPISLWYDYKIQLIASAFQITCSGGAKVMTERREALVVGINRYPLLRDTKTSKPQHLEKPATDAEAIAQILENYGDFGVRRLPEIYHQGGKRGVDSNPVPQNLVRVRDLEEAIAQLFNPPSKSIPDTAVLFFAGHGLRKDQGGVSEGFLATSDANPQKGNWGVSLRWLRQLLQESPVRQQIVWLDCCYSGELLNFEQADPGNRGIARDRCLITASREFEVAFEELSGNHGVLTGALLPALNPEQHPDGWVTNYSLVDFIRNQLQHSRQRPLFHNIGGEIILTGKAEQIGHAVLMAGICPYKGLSYFDFNEEDPKYFYGRTQLTDQLLEKVREGNFLAVLGASGSGKSSVVRAGLLHQLKLGQRLGGSDQWVIKIFRPGEEPLKSLAMAFAKDENFNTYVQTRFTNALNSINRGAEGLHSLVQTTARNRRLVLVVDQFEEAFTLCQDETERQRFFECLLGALEIANNQLCVILTMRADFFGKCAEQDYGGLASKIQENLVTVTPMNRQQLEQAITEPAKKVGLEVQRELVAQMLEDVEGPASLPLLQYTLTELWQKREVERLTLAEYTRLGGVKGTLQKRADEVYQSLSEQEKRTAKHIFLELTQLGEGTEDTRRQVSKTELINEQLSATLVEKVLQKLADARLVVTSELRARGEGDETVTVVDVAHEALIRHWSLLRHWVNENREAIRRERKIEDAAEEWERQGKPHDMAFLLQGAKLDEAESFLQDYADLGLLSGLAQEFIRVSQGERERQKQEKEEQLKREQEQNAELKRALNQEQQARTESNLVNQAAKVQYLLKSQPIDGLILAIQSMGLNLENLPKKILPSVEEALRQGIEQAREKNILSHEGEVTSVAISQDGQLIVSGSQDKTVRLWDAQGNPMSQPLMGHEGAVTSVAISPDGKYIASGSEDKTVRLWNTNGQPIGKPFRRHEDRGTLAKLYPLEWLFDSYGLWSILALLVWLGVNFSLVSFLAPSLNPVLSFFFVLLFNLIILFLVVRFVFKLEGGITSVAFSPYGKYIISGSQDKTVRLWECNGQGGKLMGVPLYGHKGNITSIVFSPDGKYIASGSQDKTVRLWKCLWKKNRQKNEMELKGAKLSGTSFKNHTEEVTSVAFTLPPAGKRIGYIISGSKDKTVRLWDCQPKEHNTFGKKLNLLREVCKENWGFTSVGLSIGVVISLVLWIVIAYNPQSNWFIALFIVLVIDVLVFLGWSLSVLTREILIYPRRNDPLRRHENDVTAVTISPDGQTIISGSRDKTVRLWNLQNDSTNQTLVGHSSDVTAVAISPDGQTIISASTDNTVRLWDMKDNPMSQHSLQQGSSVNTWESWLQVACNRLRYHPILKNPETSEAKQVCEICQKYRTE